MNNNETNIELQNKDVAPFENEYSDDLPNIDTQLF